MARVIAPPRREPGPSTDAPAVSPSRPDLLLIALASMIWIYVWRVQDLVPLLAPFKLSLLVAGVTTGLLVLDRDPGRRLGHLHRTILVCAAGLALMALLGIPTSLWPRNSATSWLKELVPNLLLMVMLAASVRRIDDLEWIALMTLLGAGVYSLFGLLRFGLAAGGGSGDLVYYDENDLALVLLCTMPLALYFLVRGRWRYRLLAAGSLVPIGMTFAASGSRGGFVGLVAMLAFILVAYRAIPRRIRILTVVAGLGVFAVLAGENYRSRILTLGDIQSDYNWSGQATEGRMEVWRRGVGYMADHPLLGVGLRNFTLAEGMLSEEAKARAERGRGFKWSAAHNSFLELGVELGIPALLLFVGLLVATFRALGRIRRDSDALEPRDAGVVGFASALTTALVGFCVAGAFVSAEHFSLLYVLIGMALGSTKLHELDRLQAFVRLGWFPPSGFARRVPLARGPAAVYQRRVHRQRRVPALPRERPWPDRGAAEEGRGR